MWPEQKVRPGPWQIAAGRVRSRGLALMASCLVLAACAAPDAAVLRQPLPGGTFSFALPQGYCADPGATRRSGDGALMIGGRCSGASGRPAAVLTAAVAAQGSGGRLQSLAGQEAMAAWFRSPEGRRALSQRGRAGDVSVPQVQMSGPAVLALVADRRAPEGSQIWRAVLPLQGRLVTLTVAGPPGERLDPAAGQALMTGFISRLRMVNR